MSDDPHGRCCPCYCSECYLERRRIERTEIAPGCFLVSSEGTSRSGDSIADTVAAICREADRRAARR